MVTPVNLLSLKQAYDSFAPETFEKFKNHFSVELGDDEIVDLMGLIGTLVEGGARSTLLEGFHVGYQIPQIGKEFDLLRFGEGEVLNIEVKRFWNEEKVFKQLSRNQYYLKVTEKNLLQFCYISDNGLLVRLDKDGALEESDIKTLMTSMDEQVLIRDPNLNSLFDPSQYLVSPFNSPERFSAKQYFLTHQQEEFAGKIERIIGKPRSAKFVALSGAAGTGKTLLAYHVAQSAMEKGYTVKIFHCGNLNSGQECLRESAWDISPAKYIKSCDFSQLDLVIVDEAQRMTTDQIEEIQDKVMNSGATCIFSYDQLQTLAKHEERANVSEKISAMRPLTQLSLSEKIRSNREVSDFIKMLINRTRFIETTGGNNIQVRYFSKLKDARDFLTSLTDTDWEVLRFTPSRFDTEFHESYFSNSFKASHAVIGQEFDRVAIVLDKFFNYDGEGMLSYTGKTYYDPPKMLFQNMTRARKKLLVVVIDNQEIFSRCLDILAEK